MGGALYKRVPVISFHLSSTAGPLQCVTTSTGPLSKLISYPRTSKAHRGIVRISNFGNKVTYLHATVKYVVIRCRRSFKNSALPSSSNENGKVTKKVSESAYS